MIPSRIATGWVPRPGVTLFPGWTWSPWSSGLLVIGALVALPLAFILLGLVQAPGEGWTMTPGATVAGYALNSIGLVGGVAAITILVGVSTGWWIATCEFPGRRVLGWMLVLPLAFPSYVAAFGYGDFLDRMIPAVLWVRQNLGPEAARSLQSVLRHAAVVGVLSSVLFPYVYLAARAAFASQSRATLEAARILGDTPASAFLHVSLPLARPAIAGGVLLVAMEVVNDYGTVAYFGIPTLTTGIFRFWFSFGDPDSAVRLAAFAMVIVFGLIGFERWARGRRQFADPGGRASAHVRWRLLGHARWLVPLACAAPVAVGFLIPAARLALWTWQLGSGAWSPEFLRQVGASLLLASGTTALIVCSAVVAGYAERLHPQRGIRWMARFATMGYAIPAAVLALGMLRALGAAGATGPLLSGSVAALVLAYGVRFLAVAVVPVQGGFKQVCGDLDAAARCLGSSPARTLARVNLPLLRPVLWSAAILVFVDVLKELPLTLLLRPFNFETLGTRAYNLVDQGRLQDAAPACLLIVAAGLACVVVFNRFLENTRA